MNFCVHCSASLPEGGAAFCGTCGAPTAAAAPTGPDGPASVFAPPAYNPPPPYNQPPAYGQSAPYGQAAPYGQVGPMYPPAAVAAPNNYLVWAILSTLLCCLPLGIVSIVFALKVDSLAASGNRAGALDASRKAKNFAIAAAAVGATIIMLYVMSAVAFGMSTDASSL